MRANVGYRRIPGDPFVSVEASGREGVNSVLLDARAVPPGHELAGGKEPPASFMEWLRLHDPDMVPIWNRYLERWVIWRTPSFQEPVCVFLCEHPNTGEYWDLDNRVKAFLEDSKPENYGGVKQHWAFVERQMDMSAQRRQKRWRERAQTAWEMSRMHNRISVGYGRSRGDKASMHSHGGDTAKVPFLG